MKNSKAIIAVLCIIVLIFSFAACAQQKAKTESVTQVVTNENGEVVTGENGQAITEEIQAQLVTDSSGKAVTEVVTGTNGKPLTTVVNNKYVNVTQYVTANSSAAKTSTAQNKSTTKAKKGADSSTKASKSSTTAKQGETAPKAPKDISKLSVSAETQTSLKLSWSKVDCAGYQISFSSDGEKTWNYLEKEYRNTSYTVKNLVSNTEYVFRVRAYNENKAGKTPSKWKTVKAKTKENTDARRIKITVELPIDADVEDTLSIKIDKKEVKSVKVKLDGSSYSFTTEDKYRGEVEITASLKNHASATVKTDKAECTVIIGVSGIPVLIDDED